MVDGKLSDGNERGGIVGTDNGGNPKERIIFKIFEIYFFYYFQSYPAMYMMESLAYRLQQVALLSMLSSEEYSLD